MNKKIFHSAYIFLLFSISVIVSSPSAYAQENDFFNLQRLLQLAHKPPTEAEPKDKIYFKDGVAYCTGQSKPALANNRAAAAMEAGDYRGAARVLEAALKNSALFFPFRYNLGTCYIHLDDLKRALLNFQKAAAVVPEYYGVYLQIGGIYQHWNRDNDAIRLYREALKRNKGDLGTYVLIGDLFLQRNQLEVAKKYYDACLKIDRLFPNGLLGRAKIHFKQGDYYKALVLLKSIDTRGEYDKSLHYYLAECAFKLRDYKTASEQYKILLQFKNDKFFLANSIGLIEHKLYLSNRLKEK
jgi:tetratricopeptide (TPR) repeat protein